MFHVLLVLIYWLSLSLSEQYYESALLFGDLHVMSAIQTVIQWFSHTSISVERANRC